jgi:tetratricopeptide (TPR) repeat protein
MKKTILIAVTLYCAFTAGAQNVADGIKMYKYERYQSAEKQLSSLAAGNPQANYYLGLSQLAEGKIADAKATFAKFPDDVMNMSGMARVAFAENNDALANTLLQSIIGKAKKKDWEPYKYAADAINYSEKGNMQQAIDWYKAAIQRNDALEIHIALGDAYQKISGGGGEAMNNYDMVIDKDPKNSLVHSRKGALWYAAHAWNDALTSYNNAKDADPSNPIPYRDLANVFFRVGKYEDALKNIKTYMDLCDKSCDDKIQYATILFLAKHFDEAVKAANEVISLCSPVKPAIYGILGFSQKELKDTVNSVKNAMIYIHNQNPKKITTDDYLNFAWIFMQARKTDSADYYFNIATSSDSSKDKSDVYRQIAEGFKTGKDYPRSAFWYNKIIAENPGASAADYAWAAIMFYYSKDYVNGGKVAEQWETKYPDVPSATYWRARNSAAIDNEGKDCLAAPYFEKWLQKVGPNYDKKNDMKTAYEYLLLCAFNKEDKDKTKDYKDKIRAIDPNDDLVKQIEDYEKKAEEHKKAVNKSQQGAKGSGK